MTKYRVEEEQALLAHVPRVRPILTPQKGLEKKYISYFFATEQECNPPPRFMESVWWVFRTLFDKGLVYKGFKVMPYSTACATPLSNFESGQNFKEVRRFTNCLIRWISPARSVRRLLGEGLPCDEILEGGASSSAYVPRVCQILTPQKGLEKKESD